MRKEKIINECVRKSYLPPDICCVSLTDGHPLMETSIGRFEDMGYGGDLGGDSSGSGGFNDMLCGGDLGSNSGNSGGFNDMLWGGDLGINSGNSGGFNDMLWGGDLGSTVIGH